MRIFTRCVCFLLALAGATPAFAARFTVLVGQGGGNNYSPATLNIRVGDDVEFRWVSGVHPTASSSSPQAWTEFVPSAQQPSIIIPASTFRAGVNYPYFCTVHGGMNGEIRVAATPTPTLAPSPGSTLNLFPNPSKGGLLTVALNERPSADYKLRLRNIIGQEVRTVVLRPELMRGAALRLDWSDLPAGLYFYTLLVDNKAVLTKRLTLQ